MDVLVALLRGIFSLIFESLRCCKFALVWPQIIGPMATPNPVSNTTHTHSYNLHVHRSSCKHFNARISVFYPIWKWKWHYCPTPARIFVSMVKITPWLLVQQSKQILRIIIRSCIIFFVYWIDFFLAPNRRIFQLYIYYLPLSLIYKNHCDLVTQFINLKK